MTSIDQFLPIQYFPQREQSITLFLQSEFFHKIILPHMELIKTQTIEAEQNSRPDPEQHYRNGLIAQGVAQAILHLKQLRAYQDKP